MLGQHKRRLCRNLQNGDLMSSWQSSLRHTESARQDREVAPNPAVERTETAKARFRRSPTERSAS